MPYIGNNLTIQQYSPTIASFTGNGSTTAFTLPIAVVTPAQIVVSVNNVIQNPNYAYTVSGSTLTFTSAPPANSTTPVNIWVEYTSLQTNLIQPAAGTVTPTSMSQGGPSWNTSGAVLYNGSYGISGQFLQSQGSITAPAWASLPLYPGNYLVVAGGGCGGTDQGGGGGGGGFLAGAFTFITGTTYTIVVGAGAAGNNANTNANGGNSVFASYTAIGGGSGGGVTNGPRNGYSGGSGGGGSAAWSTGVQGLGGSGTSGQGNSGGNGSTGSTNSAGGGGGGAGAAGGSGNGSTVSGNGGNGLQSSITGSAVYYAGGGGGGNYNGTTAGTGGLGGGANGGGPNTTGPTYSGTANTGGGGGGGVGNSTVTAGSGGSGVVILSIPTLNYSGTTTGSPTVTTNGLYKVLTFTSSGTYTA
jgi:hypothetical protein